MILEGVMSDVAAQLEDQSKLGVEIVDHAEIPEEGPVYGGVWWRVPNSTAVFADIKRSTSLSTGGSRKDAAYAYTYFVRAMTVIFERFGARYIDIQGDGIFGLFSGAGSLFSAAACAVTMRTEMASVIEPRFLKDASMANDLKVGIGMDRGTLLVRRLGLRGTRQNEVWAGRPVNVAAKLTSVAADNQVVVSDRVFKAFSEASQLRQRVLLWTCGCQGGVPGGGLELPAGVTTQLWAAVPAPGNLGLDFMNAYRLESQWCGIHGAEFCEALITGNKQAG